MTTLSPLQVAKPFQAKKANNAPGNNLNAKPPQQTQELASLDFGQKKKPQALQADTENSGVSLVQAMRQMAALFQQQPPNTLNSSPSNDTGVSAAGGAGGASALGGIGSQLAANAAGGACAAKGLQGAGQADSVQGLQGQQGLNGKRLNLVG